MAKTVAPVLATKQPRLVPVKVKSTKWRIEYYKHCGGSKSERDYMLARNRRQRLRKEQALLDSQRDPLVPISLEETFNRLAEDEGLHKIPKVKRLRFGEN